MIPLRNWYGSFIELPRNPNINELSEGIKLIEQEIDRINDSVGLDMSTLETSINGNELGFFKIGWHAQEKGGDDDANQQKTRTSDEHIRKLSPALEKRILNTVMFAWNCFPCQKRMMDSLSGTDDGIRVSLLLACPLCDLHTRMFIMHHTLDESMDYEPWRINAYAAEYIRKQIETQCRSRCPYLPQMSIHDGHVENFPWAVRPAPAMSDDVKAALLNGDWDPPENNKE